MKKFLTCALLAFALTLNAQAKDKDKEKYKDEYKDKDKYNGPVVSVPDNVSVKCAGQKAGAESQLVWALL